MLKTAAEFIERLLEYDYQGEIVLSLSRCWRMKFRSFRRTLAAVQAER